MRSHSLAALIAMVRASAGELELPLKTNLLRSFHIVQRIHGKRGIDTMPVGERQGFAHRAVHLASNAYFFFSVFTSKLLKKRNMHVTGSNKEKAYACRRP